MQIEITNENNYNIEILDSNSPTYLLDNLQDKPFFLCIDERVYFFFKDYLQPLIDKSQDYLIINATEDNKTMKTVDQIHAMLFNKQASRNSNLLAIGGGIIGDVVGLAAALYMRGINLIQVPTTLLAQVDSSIGNKVAINAHGIKNVLGTFYAPDLVVIDLFFLNKLTSRIFKEGLVELIKQGLIADASIVDDLNKIKNIDELRHDTIKLKSLIQKALLVKKKIVEIDPLDQKERHVLNLAHTYAHALETSYHELYYHGEAVALGLLVNACSSNQKTKDIVFNLLDKFQCLRKLEDIDLSKVMYDKKRKDDYINEVYMLEVGQVVIKKVLVEDLILEFKQAQQQVQAFCLKNEPLFEFKPVSLQGSVLIPPSKSQLHRYLIGAALSKRKTVLKNVSSIYDDILVTMEALKAFNMHATFNQKKNQILIEPKRFYKHEDIQVHMKESGTSLRLLLPLLINDDRSVLISGDNKLPTRPMDIYLDILAKQDISYHKPEDKNLPIEIKGDLKPGLFELAGNVSSQFISGLLFTLPLLNGDSTIKLTTKLESLPYVKMSLQTLNDFNIKIKVNEDYTEFTIKGNQEYQSKATYIIEQDYSSRCFFEVAKSFDKHNITIENPIEKTYQGDSKVISVIKNNEKLLDLSDIPDVAPIMAIYYSINGGVMSNTQRLKFKESDRLQAICDYFDIMNVSYQRDLDSLKVNPSIIKGGFMNTYHDHRITMSIIIASTLSDSSVYINEVKSINKSFSTFLNVYENLGGFVDEK